MPAPYRKEFRDDVVPVAENRELGVTIEQISTDFGVYPRTLQQWLQRAHADRDDAVHGAGDRSVWGGRSCPRSSSRPR